MDWKTAVVRISVKDTEAAISQAREDVRNAEKAGSLTTMPKKSLNEMLDAIGYSLSDCALSNDEEDGEDEYDDEDAALHKLGEHYTPCLAMGKIPKAVKHCMNSFRPMQIRHDDLKQPGWGDAANYFGARDMNYRTAEFEVPAGVIPWQDRTAATPSPTTFGKHMQSLDIVPGQWEMPQGTSQSESNHMRLGSWKPQSD